MRPIDADKLYPDCLTKEGTLAISQSQIANAPTVVGNFDKLVMPHGEWVYVGMSTLGLQIARCTKCNEKAYGMSDFCPNCGADMRKDGGNG